MCCSCICVDEPTSIHPQPRLPTINTVPEDLQIDKVDLLIAGDRGFEERVLKAVSFALGDDATFSIRIVRDATQFENALLKRPFQSPKKVNGRVQSVEAAAFNVIVVQYDKQALCAKTALEKYVEIQKQHRTQGITNKVVLISTGGNTVEGVGIFSQRDFSNLLFSNRPYFRAVLSSNLTEDDWLGIIA